jgi:hypothetical protein
MWEPQPPATLRACTGITLPYLLPPDKYLKYVFVVVALPKAMNLIYPFITKYPSVKFKVIYLGGMRQEMYIYVDSKGF